MAYQQDVQQSVRASEVPSLKVASHVHRAFNPVSLGLRKGSLRTEMTTSSSPKTFSSHSPGLDLPAGCRGRSVFATWEHCAIVVPETRALSYRTAVVASVSLQVVQGDAELESSAVSRVFPRSLQRRIRRALKTQDPRQHGSPVPCGREHECTYGSQISIHGQLCRTFPYVVSELQRYPVGTTEWWVHGIWGLADKRPQ